MNEISLSDDANKTGMLDVGTHCGFCQQLDFLTFHCKHCNGDFCSQHRSIKEHHCPHPPKTETQTEVPTSRGNGGDYLKILLPEDSATRVQKGHTLHSPQPTGKDILGASTKNENALSKLIKFFQAKKKLSNYNEKISKSKNRSPVYMLASIKKSAKGDNNIPVDKRMYIKCYVIDDNVDNEPTDIFINNTWSLGKTLDYLASSLGVSNNNTSFKTTDEEQLFLCKNKKGGSDSFDMESIECLDLSLRVQKALVNLEVVYLVRGHKFR
ncbi:hypothetical protein TPHA_0I01250 [Tetrapisispora phaffii CBS 4417]|uniref:AN1-type domain-containing protein n=1 Tax=Tetrapisispora phaffii (strain ATCC 24235 / CBS 4417 / NBRC 1672 / NRRL Y-8282 / UCD 70-5) TaxID=1071381 RepID=G8BXK3_TETPH|nr:hypothetical protein TPHA_0I01250 [Tetrapisispora phaffii CBS 4417]CCE64631.1 hypothetical protein TPHA_0I01250 [Tetrapisispora phaffii CBS 4417]